MKNSPRPPRHDPTPRKSGGGMLLGLFIGLVIGVLIAFGVVLYLNKSPLPFMNKFEGASNGAKPAAPAGGAPATPQPLPLPGKPGDKPTEKGRFDFYGILEGKQQPNPGTGAASSIPPPAAAPAPTAAPEPKPVAEAPKASEVFYLQAGAFQKAADADNLKAKLALLGVDASVQEANIPDKGVMFRVRVGPLKSPEDMNRVRTQLAQGGIQATVAKQKE